MSNVQKSASSPSNTPWVAHLKSAAMSNVNKNVHALNNHQQTPIQNYLLPPTGFRPPSVSRSIQPSPSYQKYSAQIRSQGYSHSFFLFSFFYNYHAFSFMGKFRTL